MDGADLDALLEAKYEHDLDEELLGQLEGEEEGNDETFGSLSEPVGMFQSPLSASLPRFCKTSKRKENSYFYHCQFRQRF